MRFEEGEDAHPAIRPFDLSVTNHRGFIILATQAKWVLSVSSR